MAMTRTEHGDAPVAEEEIVETGTEHAWTPWRVFRGWLGMLAIWAGIALILVETLLGFRLGFQLGEANPANNFVEFIYDTSGPLVQPFEGISSVRELDGGGIFEPATAIAMGVYFVAALLLMLVLWGLTQWPLAGGEYRARRTQYRAGAEHR
jgi:hypothetical protein